MTDTYQLLPFPSTPSYSGSTYSCRGMRCRLALGGCAKRRLERSLDKLARVAAFEHLAQIKHAFRARQQDGLGQHERRRRRAQQCDLAVEEEQVPHA